MPRSNESTKRCFFFLFYRDTKYIPNISKIYCWRIDVPVRLSRYWHDRCNFNVFEKTVSYSITIWRSCIHTVWLFMYTSNIRHVRYARACTVVTLRLCFSVDWNSPLHSSIILNIHFPKWRSLKHSTEEEPKTRRFETLHQTKWVKGPLEGYWSETVTI